MYLTVEKFLMKTLHACDVLYNEFEFMNFSRTIGRNTKLGTQTETG